MHFSSLSAKWVSGKEIPFSNPVMDYVPIQGEKEVLFTLHKTGEKRRPNGSTLDANADLDLTYRFTIPGSTEKDIKIK